MTRVKICGISCRREIEAVNEFLPDYIGFVFVSSSRRAVTLEQAGKLKSLLHSGIKAVGVFADADISSVANAAGSKIIDIIQLHGSETEEYIENLRKLTNAPIIKAVRPALPEELTLGLNSPADMLLFDSIQGGSGRSIDISALPKAIKKPFFIAGGLNTEKIENILQISRPFGLDVSSGVETGGQKDREKIRDFITAVRKFDRNNERME